MIDYERMQRAFPKQKAALTRASKKGYAAVLATCTATVREWDMIGAWPDDWARWQRALDDAFYQYQREARDNFESTLGETQPRDHRRLHHDTARGVTRTGL